MLSRSTALQTMSRIHCVVYVPTLLHKLIDTFLLFQRDLLFACVDRIYMNPNMCEMAAELACYRLHERATLTVLNIQEQQDPLCT